MDVDVQLNALTDTEPHPPPQTGSPEYEALSPLEKLDVRHPSCVPPSATNLSP